MKNIFTMSIMALLLGISFSCSSTKNYQDTEKTAALVQSGTFTFMAEKANPTNLDVVNILNTMPGGNAARIFNLDSGYTIKVEPEKITADLPYFGRMFIANLDPKESGFKFTSTNFTIDKSKSTAKKQVWIVNLNDVSSAQQMYFEIYPGGSTIVSINSKDRQAISYSGYITDTASSK